MIRAARLALLSISAVALMALQAPGLSVQFPTGWTPREGSQEGIISAVAPDGRTNCTAHSNAMPTLDGFTQEEINAQMSGVFGETEWASLAGLNPATITVREAESRPIDGTFMQVATIDLQANAQGNPEPMTIRMAAYVLPGRVVGVGCFAGSDIYPQHAAEFERTASSLRPR